MVAQLRPPCTERRPRRAVLRHRAHRPARCAPALRNSRCERRRVRKAAAQERRLSAGEPLCLTVSVRVTEGELQAGDTINVVYGDMSGGGRGFTPPLWTGSPDRVRAAVDPTGDGAFTLLPDCALPWLNNEPGPPVELLLVLESPRCCGQENARPHGGAGRIPQSRCPRRTLLSIWPSKRARPRFRQIPSSWDASTWGCGELTVTPTEAGVLRLRGTSTTGISIAFQTQARSLILGQSRPIHPQRACIGAIFTPTASTLGTAPAQEMITFATRATPLSSISTAPPTTTTGAV